MAQSFREPHHLPNRRDGREPNDPYELPRQRNGITPQMHGRFPDYNVLDEADHWDDVTRRVVMARVDQAPEIRFFTGAEAATLEAFCNVVTAQDREPRIPVLRMIDAKLHDGRLDGFQYASMPDDRDTWRLVARGLDEQARGRYATDSFARLREAEQRHVVGLLARGQLEDGVWADVPPATAWKVVTRAILSEFYSHPWAWNEIGYGGPAYPRGFARLGVGQSEAWEGEEAFGGDPVQDVKRWGLE
jgi:hypothetical protein